MHIRIRSFPEKKKKDSTYKQQIRYIRTEQGKDQTFKQQGQRKKKTIVGSQISKEIRDDQNDFR